MLSSQLYFRLVWVVACLLGPACACAHTHTHTRTHAHTHALKRSVYSETTKHGKREIFMHFSPSYLKEARVVPDSCVWSCLRVPRQMVQGRCVLQRLSRREVCQQVGRKPRRHCLDLSATRGCALIKGYRQGDFQKHRRWKPYASKCDTRARMASR